MVVAVVSVTVVVNVVTFIESGWGCGVSDKRVPLSGGASLARAWRLLRCGCGATLAVGTTVPATTKARQYCRGGAAVRL